MNQNRTMNKGICYLQNLNQDRKKSGKTLEQSQSSLFIVQIRQFLSQHSGSIPGDTGVQDGP